MAVKLTPVIACHGMRGRGEVVPAEVLETRHASAPIPSLLRDEKEKCAYLEVVQHELHRQSRQLRRSHDSE